MHHEFKKSWTEKRKSYNYINNHELRLQLIYFTPAMDHYQRNPSVTAEHGTMTTRVFFRTPKLKDSQIVSRNPLISPSVIVV